MLPERLVAERELIRVDLREATFIDSAFMRCLVIAQRTRKQERFTLSCSAAGRVPG